MPNAPPQIPAAYHAALGELADALREAHGLADILVYFAGQLRGARPDLEGPPLDICPSPGRVRRALERRDRALDETGRLYSLLPAEVREGLTSPEELLWTV
jgi:hypothetical protein